MLVASDARHLSTKKARVRLDVISTESRATTNFGAALYLTVQYESWIRPSRVPPSHLGRVRFASRLRFLALALRWKTELG